MKIEQIAICTSGGGYTLTPFGHIAQCFVEAASTQLTASVCRR